VAIRRVPVSKAKKPERIFADEISGGELPSIRSIKARARCGTPRAQEIRDSLTALLQAAPETA
jgi:hypothetical protein